MGGGVGGEGRGFLWPRSGLWGAPRVSLSPSVEGPLCGGGGGAPFGKGGGAGGPGGVGGGENLPAREKTPPSQCPSGVAPSAPELETMGGAPPRGRVAVAATFEENRRLVPPFCPPPPAPFKKEKKEGGEGGEKNSPGARGCERPHVGAASRALRPPPPPPSPPSYFDNPE